MTHGPEFTSNEPERLSLLNSLCLLDTPEDSILDAITTLAARMFNVPIALVSLIDEHRQWFKSNYGLAAKETPRNQAFCAYAIHSQSPFIVLNAMDDPRFADNPLVTSSPNIRFYAGVPIVIDHDKCIGTLCIIDKVPRSGFDQDEVELLVQLCALVKARIELLATVGYFDPLTQLPNRTRYIEDSEALVKSRDATMAPLMSVGIDLCGEGYFREVTKALGWEYAEAMLIGAKEKLRITLSSHMLYRISTTLFALNIEERKVHALVESVTKTFANPIEHNGIPYSFDIAMSSISLNQSLSSQDLIRAMTTTVDQARHLGVEHLIYEKSLETTHQQAFNILMAIPAALASQNQFNMHYQPKVDLATGDLVGVEALIRWSHPEMGVIEPGLFIPLAEKTALMRRITHWVLNHGLRQAAEWQSKGYTFSLALNVSAVDLDSDHFVSKIKGLVEAYNVDPSRVELEFTESALSMNPMATIQRLNILREMGIKLSIDDFGTGYNNLCFLKTLPATELKIDQSFIQNLLLDARNMIIVQSLISIAKAFGFKVIAEGIESEKVYETLREFGCDFGQGYWIARPMPLAIFEKWLQSRSL